MDTDLISKETGDGGSSSGEVPSRHLAQIVQLFLG